MRKVILLFALNFLLLQAHSQTAPPHLKYFGFALVDCMYDDPLDASTTTNYLTEVDSFSNIAQLAVYDFTDNIVSRTNFMNTYCVKPFLSIQAVFFHAIDTLAPSGNHFVLYSNYLSRWNTFKSTNLSVLDSTKIGAFYIADEPYWNGIAFSQLDSVCQLVKTDFPNIPIIFIEAYTILNSMIVPTTVDWVGFDRYAIFNPATDPVFLADLDTLKSKLSSPAQKVFLTIDDQWLPFYGAAGYPPDTMRFVVQNYYNLAASDTSITGMIGYLWAGGLDDPGQLGVRNMPQSVIDKNIEIGKMIKANYNLCSATEIAEAKKISDFSLFPNPSSSVLNIQFTHPTTVKIKITTTVGQEITNKQIYASDNQLDVSTLPNGIYFLQVENENSITIKKIVISK